MATRADLHAAYSARGRRRASVRRSGTPSRRRQQLRALGVRAGSPARPGTPDRAALDSASAGCAEPSASAGGGPHRRAGVRREVPALHLPDAHPRLLRAGGQERGRRRPGHLRHRRAARDAIHFPKLLDRFWQNTRRCVGWDVQYFGTVEPQRRGAPHFHAAIRGTIPRTELRAITAATYHQVWWPRTTHRLLRDKLPRWDTRPKAFVDPDTRNRSDLGTGLAKLTARTW